MSRRKKKFSCDHRGEGLTCHHCSQPSPFSDTKKQAKQEWEASFIHDPIDLRPFPKNVVLKAREILSGLGQHRNYRDFRGKRLRHDRFIISIPVTRHYRLLCRYKDSVLIPEAVISHEDYNVCKPGG